MQKSNVLHDALLQNGEHCRSSLTELNSPSSQTDLTVKHKAIPYSNIFGHFCWDKEKLRPVVSICYDAAPSWMHNHTCILSWCLQSVIENGEIMNNTSWWNAISRKLIRNANVVKTFLFLKVLQHLKLTFVQEIEKGCIYIEFTWFDTSIGLPKYMNTVLSRSTSGPCYLDLFPGGYNLQHAWSHNTSVWHTAGHGNPKRQFWRDFELSFSISFWIWEYAHMK